MSLISPADVTVPVTVQGRTSLDQARAFAIIVPMDLSLVFKGWGGIFPGVRGANNQTGSWDHVGAYRNPDMSDGTTAVETLTEYTAPHSFAYELVAFTNILGRLAAGVRGEWTFTPDGARTVIRWTYEFMPRRGRAVVVRRFLAPLWRRYMASAMTDTIVATESIAAADLATPGERINAEDHAQPGPGDRPDDRLRRQEVMKPRRWWGRRLARLVANPAQAVYGTIVATALIAAVSAHDDDPGRIAIVVTVTLLVFWIAHVYAELLGRGLRNERPSFASVRATMVDELAMVEAPALSVAILLLGAAGLIGHGLAINLALANGVVQLWLWGVAVARQLGSSWPVAMASGLVNAAFGVVIVILNALVH